MQVTYSEGVHRLLADSQEAAGRFRHRTIHTEHLLLGLLAERSSGTRVLKSLGYDRHELIKTCEKRCDRGHHTMGELRRFTPRVQEIMAVSRLKMAEFGHDKLDTRHILLGLILEPTGTGGQVLRDAGLTPQALESAILAPVADTEQAESRSRRSRQVVEKPLWRRVLHV